MKLTSTLAALVAVSTFAFPATAAINNEVFTVDFSFDRTAPVEVTYENFQDIAERACRSREEPFSITLKFRSAAKRCVEDLLGKAVLQTEMPDLIALHNGEQKAN